MKFAALALFICPALALAAKPINTTMQDPSCPVQIKNFATGPSLNADNTFQVVFTNKTDRTIIGAQFTLEFMNPVGDFVSYYKPVEVADAVKPEKKAHWAGRLIPASDFAIINGFRVVLTKVAYDNGTTWEDNGTQQCKLTQDDRKGQTAVNGDSVRDQIDELEQAKKSLLAKGSERDNTEVLVAASHIDRAIELLKSLSTY